MDEDQARGIALQNSLLKTRIMSEPAEQTRDINILAASSKLQIAKQEGDRTRVVEADPTPPDFSKMVGKTFVKRTPGIYVGASYEVKALAGDMFHVVRNDPAHGLFEYTIKCQMFHDMMKLPDKKVEPKPEAPKPKKPVSPWEKDK